MSDPPDKRSLLSAFDLGPAWARDDKKTSKNYENHRGDDRDEKRGRGRQQGGFGDRREGGGGGARRGGGGQRRDFGRQERGPRELPDPAVGVKVELVPAKEAVRLLVKEIHHVARVYSLFDLAQLLLHSRDRFTLQVSASNERPALYRGRKDASLFESKEEAIAHFWNSEAVAEFYETEETETDPPAGNFQVVARCGLSGEWLGPPNFHAYQTNLRRLHRERFPHMAFEAYAARVKTERGEEAVNAWLETMKKRTRWRPKGGDDDSWTFDRGDMERDFSLRLFDEAFEQTRKTELPGDVPPVNVSSGLMASIRIAGGHARRHPAMLIPTICRMLESEHLSIFKRQGKLFSGPARPHPLPEDAVLSERPQAIVNWLDANPEAKLGDLWTAVLPEDATETPKEWLIDMFWLLTQGHVLLFSDDKLVLPKRRAAAAGKPAAKVAKPEKAAKRKRKRKRKLLKARVPAHGKTISRISRMNEGAVRCLKGSDRMWAKRLQRRGKIESMLPPQPTSRFRTGRL